MSHPQAGHGAKEDARLAVPGDGRSWSAGGGGGGCLGPCGAGGRRGSVRSQRPSLNATKP